jgi:glycosyltransferase involved in cell wall biosynthesis
MPKYSVCMTCYNEAETVRKSLESLLGQLNDDYEIIVVDSFSTDGTYEILHEFAKSHKIKVIQERTSRGEGRQAAFENAFGEYIIANLDLDDIFKPVLNRVVTLYHENFEGELVAFFNLNAPRDEWVQNITIGPRQLIASLGGWRDLNIYEDWDLWNRAALIQKYHWTVFEFAENKVVHTEPKSAVSRLAPRYLQYREKLRLRMKIFNPGEKTGASQKLAYVAARLAVFLRGTFSGQNPNFDSMDPRLYTPPIVGEVQRSTDFNAKIP